MSAPRTSRALAAALAAAASACAEATPGRPVGGAPAAAAVRSAGDRRSAPPAAPAQPEAQVDQDAGATQAQGFPVACGGDDDCGYDPVSQRCGSDPRYNRQPPVVDQGVLCYCDAGACALLRVLPVPCEGDSDCAVASEPRPHPVRASRENPHERGRPCRDVTVATRCEQTNLCTLHRPVCPAR